MEDLITALQILLKYGNPDYPTHCEHDVLMICNICPKDVSEEDIKKLGELGFFTSHGFDEPGEECFISYKYGSA